MKARMMEIVNQMAFKREELEGDGSRIGILMAVLYSASNTIPAGFVQGPFSSLPPASRKSKVESEDSFKHPPAVLRVVMLASW